MAKDTRIFHILNAVTATTVSDTFEIANAERIDFTFKRSNHSSGSSAFKFEVSPDGTEWIQYNKLVSNLADSNAESLTRVASVTLSSDTTVTYAAEDALSGFSLGKVTVTETDDGTHDAWVGITR